MEAKRLVTEQQAMKSLSERLQPAEDNRHARRKAAAKERREEKVGTRVTE